MNMGCKQFAALHRRRFLSIGGSTLFGLTLTDLLRAEEKARNGPAPRAKQMVCVWLGGGPPHIDSFDMKPDAPEEIRGEFKPIATNTPGTKISELLPRLAKITDKYTIIRSCTTGASRATHGADTNYWLTGNPRDVPKTPKYPTWGSVVSHMRSAPAGVPAFVSLGSGGDYLTDSFLGSAEAPLVLANREAKVLKEMLTVPQVRLPAFDREANLVEAFNQQRRQLDRLDPLLEGRNRFQQKAFDLLRSAKMAQALQTDKEPEKTHERYGNVSSNKARGGRSNAESVLLARRLIEAGVPFVHVPIFSWDFHSKNAESCRNCFPTVDTAVASLIEDLDERGLLDTTIVALLGEMGRTPWGQGTNGGRDHWPTQFVVVAGGGFAGGRVVGATDHLGAEITKDEYSVESFARTMYSLLGIDPNHELLTTDGRPLRIVVNEAPIIREALA